MAWQERGHHGVQVNHIQLDSGPFPTLRGQHPKAPQAWRQTKAKVLAYHQGAYSQPALH